MLHEQQLLEHLSNEITAHANYVFTFRTRIAFTVLIGPFVILGSVLAASSGRLNSDKAFDPLGIGLLVLAEGSFLFLAYLGSRLERHVTSQCDVWRRQIIRICNAREVKRISLKFSHRPCKGYFASVLAVSAAFISISIYVVRLLSDVPSVVNL
jgi:hypothetical protein